MYTTHDTVYNPPVRPTGPPCGPTKETMMRIVYHARIGWNYRNQMQTVTLNFESAKLREFFLVESDALEHPVFTVLATYQTEVISDDTLMKDAVELFHDMVRDKQEEMDEIYGRPAEV